MVSQIPAIGCNCECRGVRLGRKSTAEVGSYAFGQWVWMISRQEQWCSAGGCRIQQRCRVGDLERFDNLAVDAVVTELDALL